jgi:AraC-like DNA-binding protein
MTQEQQPQVETVSVVVVRALAEAVAGAGVPAAEFLRAAELPPALLERLDSRLPLSWMHRMCELALDQTGDPALGLHWAERLGEATFVPVSHLLMHAATLRQAFGSLAQFHRLISDHPGYCLVEQGEALMLQAPRLPGQSWRARRFAAEMTLLALYRLVRYFDANARAEQVCFDYPAPAYHAEYERAFAGAVRFEQPFSGIVLDRALMDATAPHKDADVHAALEALAERRLQRITQQTPLAQRVREFIVREGWRQQADMNAAARALGLSVRSLRRRLAEEGSAYHDIASDALAVVAKQFLEGGQHTIQETAYEMGFSAPSTFHRAFKRWTGTTPTAYRQGQLRGE